MYRDGYCVIADGLRLHYRDYPGSAERPPLLCLHGLTRNVRDFEALAERYSPRFRVLALDFRGRGGSDYDPRPERYTPPTYAADVQEFLDHLCIHEAIFVGTSLGGLVAMAIAALAPQRISAAILNDVGPEIGEVGIERILAYVGKGQRFSTWEEAADAIALQQGLSFPANARDDWLAMARRNCRESDGEILFDYDQAIADAFNTAGPQPKIDLWPLFAALAQKPLLVVRGELSELLNADTLEKMKAVAPAAKFSVVPNVGHAPTLGEPDALRAIDDFLEGLTE